MPKEECSQLIVPKREEVVEASTSEEAYQLRRSSVLEQEEHKPKDLFEKEIKEEVDSCFEEIKEELVDKECYEQFVPKLEKTIEPCLTEFDYQNPFRFPTVNDNFSYDPRAFQPRIKSDLLVGEHNPVVFLTESNASSSNQKSFQFASIRDDVKLEAIIEDSRERKMLRTNISRSNTIHLKNGVDLKRCLVCSERKNPQYMKNVSLEKDKLILMIGYLLRNDCTIDEAKRFMFRKYTYMCHTHITDAMDTICEALQIKNFDEIDGRCDVLMQNLMITVNSIRPQVQTSQFYEILREFFRRNFSKKQKRPNTEVDQNQMKRQQNLRCAMCSELQIRTCLKQVKMEDEKLIIMIGYIPRGDYTIEEAKQFLPKKRLYICYVHLVEVNNEIYKALQITKPEEVFYCSSELMENMMVTVNAIYPRITIRSFQKYLRNFAIRNKQHLSITG